MKRQEPYTVTYYQKHYATREHERSNIKWLKSQASKDYCAYVDNVGERYCRKEMLDFLRKGDTLQIISWNDLLTGVNDIRNVLLEIANKGAYIRVRDQAKGEWVIVQEWFEQFYKEQNKRKGPNASKDATGQGQPKRIDQPSKVRQMKKAWKNFQTTKTRTEAAAKTGVSLSTFRRLLIDFGKDPKDYYWNKELKKQVRRK